MDIIIRNSKERKFVTDWGRHCRAGQKRVVEFGEWLCQEVVKAVPHRPDTPVEAYF